MLAELGRFEEAIVAQEAALRCDAGHEAAIEQLGGLLHRMGRSEDARMVLGNAVFQLGDSKAALNLLQFWLRLMPDDPIVQHRLAAWFGQDQAPARASDAYVTYLFDRYAEGFDQHLVQELSYQAPAVIAERIAEVLGARCLSGCSGRRLRHRFVRAATTSLCPSSGRCGSIAAHVGQGTRAGWLR